MDFPSLDLRLLTVFDRMLAYRSVAAAARNLNMPQATLSRCLAQLRYHFGDPLFVRTGEGMMPTPAAIAVAEPVRAILDIYRDRLARPDQFDPETAIRTFNLAASDFGHLLVLPPLHAALVNEAPRVRLNAVPLSGDRPLIGLLESGEADVAVGGFPALYAGISKRVLYVENYVCAIHAGHPLAQRPCVSKADFATLNHIIVSARAFGHIHQAVEKQLTELLQPRAIAITSQSFVLAALIADRSDLLLTVPSRVIAALNKNRQYHLLTVPGLTLPSFEVALYWHARFNHDPANQWLRARVAALAPKL